MTLRNDTKIIVMHRALSWVMKHKKYTTTQKQ